MSAPFSIRERELLEYAERIADAVKIARALVLPAVCQSADIPAVHLHSVYQPGGSRFWIATISNYQPGDRDAESEFLTVLGHGYHDTYCRGVEVSRAINSNCGRPSLHSQ